MEYSVTQRKDSKRLAEIPGLAEAAALCGVPSKIFLFLCLIYFVRAECFVLLDPYEAKDDEQNLTLIFKSILNQVKIRVLCIQRMNHKLNESFDEGPDSSCGVAVSETSGQERSP